MKPPFCSIPLSRGLVGIIDAADFGDVGQFKWFANAKGYVVRNLPRPTAGTELLHRKLMQAKKHQYVDHINHNPLDNRRANLRLCTNSQNSMYRHRQSNNRSGYKGVSWSLVANRWRVYIKVNGKQIHLGYCDCKEMGALIYNAGALRHFGEFALLNEVAP